MSCSIYIKWIVSVRTELVIERASEVGIEPNRHSRKVGCDPTRRVRELATDTTQIRIGMITYV
ncbi:MAG: hypothetical protein H7062_10230 [Candidatus Saccharimonas sp.]|nr:hypothetical protein [Planctomycetaceae bacterium]